MTFHEQGFWNEVDQGQALVNAPLFHDWLLEQGLEDEAAFWTEVIEKGWQPEEDHGPTQEFRTYHGLLNYPERVTCWTWWSSRLGSLIDFMDYPPCYPEWLQPSTFREYPTRSDAYRALFQAWLKRKNHDRPLYH